MSLLSLLLLLVNPSLASTAALSSTTRDEACTLTMYPSYCKSLLPQSSQPLSKFTLFSTNKSLASSKSYLATLTTFLKKNRPSLSQTAVFALEDCLSLTDLAIDFLSTSITAINDTNADLSEVQTEKVHTLLSSTLTNLQTCLDGLYILNQTMIKDGVYDRISNGTMLHSVTLGLFAQAWAVPKSQPTVSRRLLSVELPVGRKIGRRLLQTPNTVVVRGKVVVSPDGSGNFTTITDAVNSAPNNSDGSLGYYLINVRSGVYEEYLSIPTNKKYVMMVGDGINQTVLTGNRSVVDGWTTFNCATFAVVAQGFVAINMSFINTAGAAKQQAVAVRNGADLSVFYLCSFQGYQDTLYTHSMRQFYRECNIYGTVDFIFGNAAVVFQNCNIYARLPMRGQSDPVTAQGRTDPSQNTGTSIHNCSILAGPDLAADNGTTKTYFGRPWKEYSRTVVMQSFLDSLIDPAGWLAWSGDFALRTLYYAEYNNTGPGSNTSNRVTWPGYHVINSTDAIDFTVTDFLLADYWLPQTGVPYFNGLL